jgi:hypothetical protein
VIQPQPDAHDQFARLFDPDELAVDILKQVYSTVNQDRLDAENVLG